MLLTSPWWLLTLALIPLVWWLHRFREHGEHYPVAALMLWQAGSQETGRGRLAPRPQPIWLLRALLVMLLALSLAAPQWHSAGAEPLTIWLDDSRSMYAVEGTGSRMQHALIGLVAELDQQLTGEIEVRSLGKPGRVLRLPSIGRIDALRAWARQPQGEPSLPAPVTLADDRQHWLVSDGASPGVTQWSEQAVLSRRLAAGGGSENSGITRLSLRRGAANDSAQLSVSVSNGGTQAVTRSVAIYSGADLLQRRKLTIAAGATAVEVLTLQLAAEQPLRAALSPSDLLPLDDELVLSTAQLRSHPLHVSGTCAAPLLAALQVLPGFTVTTVNFEVVNSETGTAVDAIRLHCGPVREGAQGAGLWFVTAPHALPLAAKPVWRLAQDAFATLILQRAWVYSTAPGVQPAAERRNWLQAGEQPLIWRDEDRGTVVVAVDFAQPILAAQPEYPLLVAALIGALAPDHGADRTLVTRAGGNVVIAPRPLTGAAAAGPGPQATVAVDLAVVMMALALLLLVLDSLWIMVQRYRRQRRLQSQVGDAR